MGTLRNTQALAGVMSELTAVMMAAAEELDFDLWVVEGLRTKETQAKYVKRGSSKTMNSRHLTGHAVDVAPYIDGKISWEWPLYNKIAPVIKKAAKARGVKITWGGDWKQFKDGPHWELDWKTYPAVKYSELINDVVLDPEHPIPSKEELPEKEKTFAQTGTVKTATVAAAGSTISVVAEIAKNVDDTKELVKTWVDYLPTIASVLVIAAVAYFAWTRWKDYKAGDRG